MGAPKLETTQLTNRQMERALALVERAVFQNVDDIEDVDDAVDEFSVEVSFYIYLDTIALDTNDKELCAYIFDADRNLLEEDTALFIDQIMPLLDEASEELRQSRERESWYEFDRLN